MSENNYSLGLGGWLFTQCALLVVHYGFDKTLPWWVLWLPSLLLGAIIICILVVLIVIGIVMLIGEWLG